MSSVFKGPSKPKLPPAPEPIEEVSVVQEDAEVAAQKRKKKVAMGGRQSTVLSGIQSALKSRLGD